MKSKIEIGHNQPTIWIPHAARTYVEQAIAGFGQHFSTVDEAQADGLSFLCRFVQNHGYLVITTACQLRALYRWVLDEFHGSPVLLHGLNLQKARQFEDQKTRSVVYHVEVQFHFCVELLGWSYSCIHHIIAHKD